MNKENTEYFKYQVITDFQYTSKLINKMDKLHKEGIILNILSYPLVVISSLLFCNLLIESAIITGMLIVLFRTKEEVNKRLELNLSKEILKTQFTISNYLCYLDIYLSTCSKEEIASLIYQINDQAYKEKINLEESYTLYTVKNLKRLRELISKYQIINQKTGALYNINLEDETKKGKVKTLSSHITKGNYKI